MENASKAIIMAGGILIALVIISMLVILFNNIGDVYIEEGKSLSVKQLEEYNRKFETYNRSLYGAEVLSFINFIDDYHSRLLSEVEGDTSSSFYKDNAITIEVYMNNGIEGYEVTDKDGKVIKKYKGIAGKTCYNMEQIKKWYYIDAQGSYLQK